MKKGWQDGWKGMAGRNGRQERLERKRLVMHVFVHAFVRKFSI
jgi:hypothetical protein